MTKTYFIYVKFSKFCVNNPIIFEKSKKNREIT